MKPMIVVLCVLLAACGEDRVTAEQAEKVVRETISEAREKSIVKIQVRLEKTEMASEQDLQFRTKIEEAIQQDAIGRVKVSESGMGYFAIHVEVDSTAESVPRIRDLLESFGVLERSTISIRSD